MSALQKILFLLLSLLFVSISSFAQISAPDAIASKRINNDTCYVFCTVRGSEDMGQLVAENPMGENAVFTWERYNEGSGLFETLQQNSTDSSLTSTAVDLIDGAYKVTINDGMTEFVSFAWVVNNWIEVTKAEIPDSSSNCDEFKIEAAYETAQLFVVDTTSSEQIPVRNPEAKFKTQWFKGSDLVMSTLSPLMFPPVASDEPIEYRLELSDEFDCVGEASVDYYSKVTEAKFTYEHDENNEAVLEVTFNNSSINYDSALWFFYKDKFRLSLEIADANGDAVDSVAFVLYDDAPIYEYEYSGLYPIKLVTVKVNETGNCYDTIYGEPIEVIESLVEVPNVFTPNGDNVNDVFMIRSQSLKTMNVKIYNRWGGLVHSWKYSNIRSKDYTYEHSVWDGRIGKRMASPGVYFYVISYEGRDVYLDNPTEEEQKISLNRIGKPVKETKTGFVHLFRERNR